MIDKSRLNKGLIALLVPTMIALTPGCSQKESQFNRNLDNRNLDIKTKIEEPIVRESLESECKKKVEENLSGFYKDLSEYMSKYPTIKIKVKQGDSYWKYADLMNKFDPDIKYEIAITYRTMYIQYLNDKLCEFPSPKIGETIKIPYSSKKMRRYIENNWKVERKNHIKWQKKLH
jgi:hypothetical protein